MKKKIENLFLLHLLLAIYSTSGIFSKLASNENFLSLRFILFYGFVIGLLGLYALGWQQIIKRMPLTTAYANKAVCTVWGTVWGVIFFDESISLWKIIGITMIVVGIVLFTADREEEQNE